MPVYNGGLAITATLDSVLTQSFKDFELIITDDNSTDNTAYIIKKIHDTRIRFFEYPENIGYPGNLERCRKKGTGDIIFLMGQDDILAQGTLEKYNKIFTENKNVGAITRPYYWFHDKVEKPVRAKKQLSSKHDSVVSLMSDLESVITVFQSLDQLSGLAFRREYMDLSFHEDIFTAHIYPFISIMKKYDVVYLRDYVIAVRIGTSQTRHVSSIYTKSPMQSWVDMFNTVFYEKKFDSIREYCIKNFVAKNFVGLVQIKNYGKVSWLFREIRLTVAYNKRNIFDPLFWFFSVGTSLLPSFMLIPLVGFYKDRILSHFLKGIQPIDTNGFSRNYY